MHHRPIPLGPLCTLPSPPLPPLAPCPLLTASAASLAQHQTALHLCILLASSILTDSPSLARHPFDSRQPRDSSLTTDTPHSLAPTNPRSLRRVLQTTSRPRPDFTALDQIQCLPQFCSPLSLSCPVSDKPGVPISADPSRDGH